MTIDIDKIDGYANVVLKIELTIYCVILGDKYGTSTKRKNRKCN